MKVTILGSSGFIGSHLANFLQEQGNEVHTPDIRKDDIYNKELGHVIYSIGVPNFLEEPFNAIGAHSCILPKILEKAKFDSLLYISSARLYSESKSTNEEESIMINPTKNNDLYNISKTLEESICFASKNKNIKIIRPSNVTGKNFQSTLFVPSIIKDAITKKKIVLHSSLDSQKDYVDIDDVVRIIPKIITNGKEQIYNIAAGENITTKKITDEIARITNCTIEVDQNATEYSFPQISIKKIQKEFNFKPSSIIPKLADIIADFKNQIQKNY